MTIVQGIGPGIAGDLKVSVTIITQGGSDIMETNRVIAGIHISDGERIARGQSAIFGDRTSTGSADYRCIFSTVDSDSDHLSAAIAGRKGVGVGQTFTCIQGLHRGMGVVEREGPGVTGDFEVTVTVITECCGDIVEADRVIAGIRVSDGPERTLALFRQGQQHGPYIIFSFDYCLTNDIHLDGRVCHFRSCDSNYLLCAS